MLMFMRCWKNNPGWDPAAAAAVGINPVVGGAAVRGGGDRMSEVAAAIDLAAAAAADAEAVEGGGGEGDELYIFPPGLGDLESDLLFLSLVSSAMSSSSRGKTG